MAGGNVQDAAGEGRQSLAAVMSQRPVMSKVMLVFPAGDGKGIRCRCGSGVDPWRCLTGAHGTRHGFPRVPDTAGPCRGPRRAQSTDALRRFHCGGGANRGKFLAEKSWNGGVESRHAGCGDSG